MHVFTWLHQRMIGRPQTKRSPQRKPTLRLRPQLDVLEGRDLPSTLTVTTNFESGAGSLRGEIAAAHNGDTIVFASSLDHKTITLNRELVINKNLTINGPGEFQLTVATHPYIDDLFDMSNGSRIFEVDGANTTVTVNGLNLQNGGGTAYVGSLPAVPYDGYGGAILNFGTMTLDGCMLSGNRAVYGGAIANFGVMALTNCMTGWVGNNQTYNLSVGGEGGVIYNAGTMAVSGCTLDRSSAYQGGGIYNAASATLTISQSTLSGDKAVAGGAIFNAGAAGALTVLDSIFSSNSPDNIFGPYADGGGNTFN